MSPHSLKLILLLLLLTACRNTATAAASPSLHLDPTQPIPIRVAALLSLMSTPEKIAQTIAAEILQQRNVGQVGGLSCDKELYPGSNVTARNQFQKEALASKFNPHRIPLHFWHESNHGGCSGGTVFPMPINLGTTWNESLVTSVFSVIANSTLACGASIAFAPVINLFQDPRYGRFQEAFSPEPQLTSKMTTASVIGLQGIGNATTYLGKGKVIALGKHFAGYGGSPGGLNAGPLVVGERELRDVWLKPWRAFTKAGGRGAMPAHNTVLDVPAHANSWLINAVFREEFGFGEGLTISDCDDVNVLQQYRVAKDPPEAAAKGLKGGTDMDLQCGPISTYTTTNIETALARKDLTTQDLDQAVKHVLTAKFAAGLFEQPMADLAGKQWLDLPAHRALAKEAAEQSLVLLKNDNQTLPFQRFQRFQNTLSNLFKVSVLGEIGVDATGKARKAMLGTYTSDDGKIQVDTGTTVEDGVCHGHEQQCFVFIFCGGIFWLCTLCIAHGETHDQHSLFCSIVRLFDCSIVRLLNCSILNSQFILKSQFSILNFQF
jgi:beta-glucosidase